MTAALEPVAERSKLYPPFAQIDALAYEIEANRGYRRQWVTGRK